MAETYADLRILINRPLPDAGLARIRRIAPEARVDMVRRRESGYADLLPEARILVGSLSREETGRVKKLQWLQLQSAGAAAHVRRLPETVWLTNASGVFGVVIAEHVLALMLGLTRKIPLAVRAADQRRWDKKGQRTELYGTTCGILGLGDLGAELAKRVKALGMRVLAVKRHVERRPAYVDHLTDEAGLDRVLAESDHLVMTLPGTDQTRHFLSRERLERMKPGAFLYNVGRGSTVDEQAMIELLRGGRLAGAGLDVFEDEPLPPHSPLWEMPEVILTPHVGGETPRHGERLAALFARNLEHYLRGEPLENVVDRTLGY